MINPGGTFEQLRAAQAADVTYRVALDLNNYTLASKGASAAASSEYSADWPAAGIINGGKTHINAGPAATADDGVGLAVWQGNVVSDGSGNLSPSESIEIDLGTTRKVNRLTLIWWPSSTKNKDLIANGLVPVASTAGKDFLIESYYAEMPGANLYNEGGYGEGLYDGGAGYYTWTGLADKNNEVDKAATTIIAGQVTGNAADYNIFEDPAAQDISKLRITISKLQGASVRARLVAVILTYAVDVTNDVTGIVRQRGKDYMLNHRKATTISVTLRNVDNKYTDTYLPTVDEIAAGFFNSELRPSLEMRVFAGFNGINVIMGTVYVDAFNKDVAGQFVRVDCRDYIKYFIKNNVTTNIKTNWSNEGLVEYLGNLRNFPSNRMMLDSTTLTAPYFMPSGRQVLTLMQDLLDATGNGEIFLDEYGNLQARSYLTNIPHGLNFFSKTAWDSGVLSDIDSGSSPGFISHSWIFDNFSDNKYSGRANSFFPEWTIRAQAYAASASAASGFLRLSCQVTGYQGSDIGIDAPWSAGSIGDFRFSLQNSHVGETALNAIVMFFESAIMTASPPFTQMTGYGIAAGYGGYFHLIRSDGGGRGAVTFLATLGAYDTNKNIWRVNRTGAGVFTVYKNDIYAGTATDTTYNTCVAFGFTAISPYYLDAQPGLYDLDDICFSDSADGVWGYQIGAAGVPIISVRLTGNKTVPAGTSLTLQASFSPDGSTWGAWQTININDTTIPPAGTCFAKVQAIFSDPVAPDATAMLGNFTIHWVAVGGSAQFSVTPDWAATDGTNIMNLRPVSTDIVGGQNYMITKQIVTAKPTFLSPVTQTAWQGTVQITDGNGNTTSYAISPTYPLSIPIGTTTVQVDLGSTQYNVPQTVNITWGTATGTTVLSSHPSKPILQIAVTGAGTITALTISGTPFVQSGQLQAESDASAAIRDDYGELEDNFQNDYIDNIDLAQEVADFRVGRFASPIDWIQEADLLFVPNAQINDRVTVTSDKQGIAATDYYLIASTDEISIPSVSGSVNGPGFSALGLPSVNCYTKPEFVKIPTGA